MARRWQRPYTANPQFEQDVAALKRRKGQLRARQVKGALVGAAGAPQVLPDPLTGLTAKEAAEYNQKVLEVQADLAEIESELSIEGSTYDRQMYNHLVRLHQNYSQMYVQEIQSSGALAGTKIDARTRAAQAQLDSAQQNADQNGMAARTIKAADGHVGSLVSAYIGTYFTADSSGQMVLNPTDVVKAQNALRDDLYAKISKSDHAALHQLLDYQTKNWRTVLGAGGVYKGTVNALAKKANVDQERYASYDKNLADISREFAKHRDDLTRGGYAGSAKTKGTLDELDAIIRKNPKSWGYAAGDRGTSIGAAPNLQASVTDKQAWLNSLGVEANGLTLTMGADGNTVTMADTKTGTSEQLTYGELVGDVTSPAAERFESPHLSKAARWAEERRDSIGAGYKTVGAQQEELFSSVPFQNKMREAGFAPGQELRAYQFFKRAIGRDNQVAGLLPEVAEAGQVLRGEQTAPLQERVGAARKSGMLKRLFGGKGRPSAQMTQGAYQPDPSVVQPTESQAAPPEVREEVGEPPMPMLDKSTRKGNKPAVSEVQDRLLALGIKGGGDDDDYYTGLAGAVTKFQKANGLSPTGTMTEETWRELRKLTPDVDPFAAAAVEKRYPPPPHRRIEREDFEPEHIEEEGVWRSDPALTTQDLFEKTQKGFYERKDNQKMPRWVQKQLEWTLNTIKDYDGKGADLKPGVYFNEGYLTPGIDVGPGGYKDKKPYKYSAYGARLWIDENGYVWYRDVSPTISKHLDDTPQEREISAPRVLLGVTKDDPLGIQDRMGRDGIKHTPEQGWQWLSDGAEAFNPDLNSKKYPNMVSDRLELGESEGWVFAHPESGLWDGLTDHHGRELSLPEMRDFEYTETGYEQRDQEFGDDDFPGREVQRDIEGSPDPYARLDESAAPPQKVRGQTRLDQATAWAVADAYYDTGYKERGVEGLDPIVDQNLELEEDGVRLGNEAAIGVFINHLLTELAQSTAKRTDMSSREKRIALRYIKGLSGSNISVKDLRSVISHHMESQGVDNDTRVKSGLYMDRVEQDMGEHWVASGLPLRSEEATVKRKDDDDGNPDLAENVAEVRTPETEDKKPDPKKDPFLSSFDEIDIDDDTELDRMYSSLLREDSDKLEAEGVPGYYERDAMALQPEAEDMQERRDAQPEKRLARAEAKAQYYERMLSELESRKKYEKLRERVRTPMKIHPKAEYALEEFQRLKEAGNMEGAIAMMESAPEDPVMKGKEVRAMPIVSGLRDAISTEQIGYRGRPGAYGKASQSVMEAKRKARDLAVKKRLSELRRGDKEEVKERTWKEPTAEPGTSKVSLKSSQNVRRPTKEDLTGRKKGRKDFRKKKRQAKKDVKAAEEQKRIEAIPEKFKKKKKPTWKIHE
tara:strand:+ start:9700 stop:13824 length:4125 start_codon:yes stop_codon:yes gene_type:complete